MAQDFASFFSALAVDVLICAVVIIVFDVLRRLKFSKKFYAPKRHIKDGCYSQPKALPTGRFLQWVPLLFKYTDDEIVEIAGYDAAMYLTMLSFGTKLFGILVLVNFVMVLPVNITGDYVDLLMRFQAGTATEEEMNRIMEDGADAQLNTTVGDLEDGTQEKYDFTDFDKVSMSNVEPRSSKLWVHVIAIYFASLTTLTLLAQYHRKAVGKRIEYLSTQTKGAESHTVLVTDIPGVKFGTMLDRLMASPLFKYLPKKVQMRIESTITTMFEFAVEGLDVAKKAVSIESTTALVNSAGKKLVSHRLKSEDIEAEDEMENHPPSVTVVSKDAEHEDVVGKEAPEEVICVRRKASDVTDMDPNAWAREKLAQGSSVEGLVEEQFKEVFTEDKVVCARVVRDTTALEPVYNAYEATKLSLGDLVDGYLHKMREKKKIKRKKTKVIPLVAGSWAVAQYGNKPVTVDTLEYLMLKLEALEGELKQLQIDAETLSSASAFVTLTTRFDQVVSATSLHHHFEDFWKTEGAPHPEDIIWNNLKWRSWERMARRILIWSAFALLCIFFMIPIGAVQAIIEIDRLEKYAVIGPIVKVSFIRGILQGILPNIVLKIFLALLPKILNFMNRLQGLYSMSSIDQETTRKYFIFQVITVFFFSFMIGSSLGQLDQLRDDIKDPSNFIDLLGTSAPQTASFFINYILVNGLVDGAVTFLRIPGLAIFWALTKFAGSPKAKARLWQEQKILYGDIIPDSTMVVLLGLVFSAVNPLVLAAALIYFVVMTIYWRYQLLYVYRQSYQSGGKVWSEVFNQVLTGLFIMQLMMLGFMAVKKFRYTPVLIPLPLITIGFKMTMDKNYQRPLSVLSLRAAQDLDLLDAALEEKELLKEGVAEKNAGLHEQYVSPAMKVDWGESRDILAEARMALDQLKGSGRVEESAVEEETEIASKVVENQA